MSDEYISLKQLAGELGMDRSHARRYVLNLGVTPAKRRTPESGGQLTLTVGAQEAEFIRHTREEQGFLDSQKPVTNETGYFYAIQLVPELAPGRASSWVSPMESNCVWLSIGLRRRPPDCSNRGRVVALGSAPPSMPYRQLEAHWF
jgi:hypothetical protein